MKCCRGCKGSAPFFICQAPSSGCWCHIAAEAIAAKQPNRLGHRDPTANAAIGNLEKRNRP